MLRIGMLSLAVGAAVGLAAVGAAGFTPASHARAVSLLSGSTFFGGEITSTGSGTIGINGRAYPITPTTKIFSRGYLVPPARLKTGMQVKVGIHGGTVIRILAPGTATNLPASHQIRGRLTAVTPTTLTLGGYTVSVAPKVDLDIHASTFTQTLAPGLWAHVWLNAHGQVDSVVANP